MSSLNLSTLKTIKINKATPHQIDYLVAKCEGYELVSDGISLLLKQGQKLLILGPNSSSLAYSPSTDPSVGFPIIERLMKQHTFSVGSVLGDDVGCTAQLISAGQKVWACGTTALIAAMRCYVISLRGESVEVPEAIQ
ncbi:phage protein NinX family protein [Hydrogenophaga sp. 2FB]|uniref:phage protein NinX family protein n=1 Tax=Hydrogenophaga sp. 2FB TaxID=2502187 RepID=UPI0014854292|nr:phage protein NinX family protein [Hydrogenophaga sp. 2FB]